METYLVVLTPCRPTLAQDATDSELAIVGEHFAHLQRRRDAGDLFLAGRTEGGEMGLIVLRASSANEVDAFLEADPAIEQGLMTAMRYPFRLALWGEPSG
jgi:uncharacterized protein YciI